MKQRRPAPKVSVTLRGGPADGTRITLQAVYPNGMPRPGYRVPVPVDSYAPTGRATYSIDKVASHPISRFDCNEQEKLDTGMDQMITSVLIYTFQEES